MIVVGNTGCAVWFNLLIGAFGVISGLVSIGNGSKDGSTLLIGGFVFIVIGLLCAVAKSSREKEAAEAVNKVYQEAYQQAAQDIKADLHRKAVLICLDCNHENQDGWIFCSSCGSKQVRK